MERKKPVIIAISGSPGAGKTTTANELNKYLNSEVVHLDRTLDAIKRLLAEKHIFELKTDSDRVSSEQRIYFKEGGKLDKIRNSNLLGPIYGELTRLYSRGYLQYRYNKAMEEGCDYFIIEGTRICYKSPIKYELPVISPKEVEDGILIYLSCPDELREERLQKRENANQSRIAKLKQNQISSTGFTHIININEDTTVDSLREEILAIVESYKATIHHF